MRSPTPLQVRYPAELSQSPGEPAPFLNALNGTFNYFGFFCTTVCNIDFDADIGPTDVVDRLKIGSSSLVGYAGGPASSLNFNAAVTIIGPIGNDVPTRVVTLVEPQAAPEIDPGSMAGGLALLVGGLVVLTGRRPRNLTA
jgi:hypothetical protein